MRVFELAQSPIWDREGAKPLRDHIESLVALESDEKVVVLDLASLGAREARLSAAGAALQSLRHAAEDRWSDALKKRPRNDRRSPVFIVIDEAHNLAPAEPTDARAQAVLDQLVTIAAEGKEVRPLLDPGHPASLTAASEHPVAV